MRKTYTALALMFAVATAWAQTPQNISARYAVPTAVAKASTTLPSVSEMITTQPEGTLYKDMSRSCEGFDYGDQKTYDSYAGDIVISKDGKKIYMKNPMLCFTTGWIVGDIDSEGNVEFKFPQVVYDQSQDATGTAYALTGYAWKMINDTEKKAFSLDTNSQSVKFKWADNKLTQVNPDDVIGLGNSSGTWMGYATWNNEFFVITDSPVKQPAATSQSYNMTYIDPVSDNASETEVTGEQKVKVVIDGSDAYLGNFYSNYWIKGTFADNKLTFPSKQYLGMESLSTNVNLHEYMLAYTMNADKTKAELADNIVFTYDPATGDMKSDQTFMVNAGTKRYLAMAGFENPVLKNLNMTAGIPAKPVITNVHAYDKTYKMGALAYRNSNLSVDGKELDTNNIFYNLYVNGKIFTFKTSAYKYLSANMTDIPYAFYDVDYTQSQTGAKGYDFQVQQDQQLIYIYQNFTKLGVKAVYVDGNTRLESEMDVYDPTAAVNNAINEGNEEKSVSYRDLSGRTVTNPTKGIFMKTVTYSNGETKTVKVLK